MTDNNRYRSKWNSEDMYRPRPRLYTLEMMDKIAVQVEFLYRTSDVEISVNMR